jgi:hypothetical protein
MKVKIKQIAHAILRQYVDGGVDYSFFCSDMSAHGYIPIEEVEIEIEAPLYSDLVNGTVKVLREAQKQKRAQAQMECDQIDEQIQSLLCLENKPSEAADVDFT